MHGTKRPRLAVIILAALLLGACGGPVFKQPEVTLQGVQLGGLGLRGGTLLVNLQVVNPNRFELNADRLSYDLALGGSGEAAGDTSWVDFATGIFDERFSVGAGDTSVVQIPVEFTYSGLGSATSALLRSGTFDYRARGTVDVDTPLGNYEVPYRKTGTVTLLGNVR